MTRGKVTVFGLHLYQHYCLVDRTGTYFRSSCACKGRTEPGSTHCCELVCGRLDDVHPTNQCGRCCRPCVLEAQHAGLCDCVGRHEIELGSKDASDSTAVAAAWLQSLEQDLDLARFTTGDPKLAAALADLKVAIGLATEEAGTVWPVLTEHPTGLGMTEPDQEPDQPCYLAFEAPVGSACLHAVLPYDWEPENGPEPRRLGPDQWPSKLRRWLKKRRTGEGSDIPVEYPDAEVLSELPWELALGDT